MAIGQIGRSLHWERGLKSIRMGKQYFSAQSLPALGAWIEISLNMLG